MALEASNNTSIVASYRDGCIVVSLTSASKSGTCRSTIHLDIFEADEFRSALVKAMTRARKLQE